MTGNATELSKTLDAQPAAIVAGADDVRMLQRPLEAIVDSLRRIAGDIGMDGLSGHVAAESVDDLAQRLGVQAQTVVDVATVTERARQAVAEARAAYLDLPRGHATAAERRQLVDEGAGSGIPYLDSYYAQQREAAATTATISLQTSMSQAAAAMETLRTREYHEDGPLPGTQGTMPGPRQVPTIPTDGPGSSGGGSPSSPGGGSPGPADILTALPVPPEVAVVEPPRFTPPTDGPGTPPVAPPAGPVPPGGTYPEIPGIDGPADGGLPWLPGSDVSDGRVPGSGAGPSVPGIGGGAPVLGGALAGGAAVGGGMLGAAGLHRLGSGPGGLGASGLGSGSGVGPIGGIGGVAGTQSPGAVLAGGAAAGVPGAAAPTGGARGGGLVAGGGPGGIASGDGSRKRRRAGALGYLAPALDEDDESAAAEAGPAAGAGSRATHVPLPEAPRDDDGW